MIGHLLETACVWTESKVQETQRHGAAGRTQRRGVAAEDGARSPGEHLGNFYVKLRIARTRKLVFFISLHEMERRLWRRSGPLDPKTSH